MVNSDPNTPAGGSPERPECPGGEPPPRFIISPQDVRDGIVRLVGAEGNHAKNVLRLGRGDIFVAVDGRGAEYEAQVQIRTADGLLGKVVRTTRRSREPVARVILAQALVKTPDLATVVKQATALGVNEFIFFEGARSEPREVTARELGHLEAVARATVKQSLRAVVPKLSGPKTFGDVLARGRDVDVALFCTSDPAAEPLADVVAQHQPGANRFLVAVGPAGGFAAEEEGRAAAAGFRPLELGPRRLRAELAGPIACALIFYAAGDLGPVRRGGG